MEHDDMNIQELEMKMWNAAKNRDSKAFLEVVDENAIMVCGGFRCSGADYAEIIKAFDVEQYKISNSVGVSFMVLEAIHTSKESGNNFITPASKVSELIISTESFLLKRALALTKSS